MRENGIGKGEETKEREINRVDVRMEEIKNQRKGEEEI